MKHVEHHIVKKNDELYELLDVQSRASNNLRNVARYRQRNLMTGLQKPEGQRHPAEEKIIQEMREGVAYYNEHAGPDKNGKQKHCDELDAQNWYVGYHLLDAMLVATHNPDYYSDAITVQTAQMILQEEDKTWKGWFAALRDYNENPEKYEKRPKMSKYRHKGGQATVLYNNQDAVIYEKKPKKKKKGDKPQKFKPGWELKFPRIREKRLDLGRHRPEGKLVMVRVVPLHECFDVQIVTDDGKPEPKLSEMDRVMSGDLGVDNFITLVSNCFSEKIIYKGGALKSANQRYNKEMARIQSEQTKGGDEKFRMTDEARELTLRRNHRVRDILLKISKSLVARCVENRIDTLIIGYNQGWKDEVNIGHKNNQEFVEIPYAQFLEYLHSGCIEYGIRFVTREESYTSQACFDAGDDIPTFGVDVKPKGGYKFSGYRRPTTTYWRQGEDGELESYKVQPRGLYRVREGKYDVNSDANGAANTLRKEWPEAFEGDGHCAPDLKDGDVIIIVHPDYEAGQALRERQMRERENKPMSNSRRKRLARKSLVRPAKLESSPSGIELCE